MSLEKLTATCLFTVGLAHPLPFDLLETERAARHHVLRVVGDDLAGKVLRLNIELRPLEPCEKFRSPGNVRPRRGSLALDIDSAKAVRSGGHARVKRESLEVKLLRGFQFSTSLAGPREFESGARGNVGDEPEPFELLFRGAGGRLMVSQRGGIPGHAQTDHPGCKPRSKETGRDDHESPVHHFPS
jgi:hypothetical protein